MTSHNRREHTVECLRALAAQVGDVSLHVYLADAGSTDGTAATAAQCGLPVSIIAGDGTWFWARGMAEAESVAIQDRPDFLLWLNDDTYLDTDAIERLRDVHRRYPTAIVVGAVRDPATGAMTYGGRLRTSSWHPQRFRLLELSDRVQFADTFNGNVVLVPWAVRERVGAIDGQFPHAYADDDYGLRARAVGVPVVQAPGSVGVCSRPAAAPRTGGLRGWKAAQQPKGLPLKAQVRYFRRHGGPWWPVTLLAQQVSQVLRTSGRKS